MSPLEQRPDADLEARLRAALHATADPVRPDPAGWRRLQARLRRRRIAVRGGGLALAGAAVALAAVTVVTTSGRQQVELGPAVVASRPPTGQPSAVQPGATPTLAPPSDLGTTPDAGGVIYSDGDSIHLADLDGTVLSTPAEGEGTSTVTDLDARPGGTTADYTIAYRVDTGDECGSLSWTHVVEGAGIVAGGGLPDVAELSSTRCPGAPVFATDGSALAWLAEGPDGGPVLQALDWTDAGPVAGSLVSFPLDLALGDPELLGFGLPRAGAESGTSGTVLLRGTPEDAGVTALPVQRQADGALALPIADPQPVPVGDGVPGTVIDADGTWSAVALPTADAEPRVGLAFGGPDGTLTTETALNLDAAGAPLFLDALGNTSVVGLQGGSAVITTVLDAGDGTATIGSPGMIAPVTSAALLGPGLAAPPGGPSPTPGVTVTPPPEAPGPVLETAAAVRAAAQARDWQAIDALIPDDGFTSSFGGAEDHVGYYQQEEANGIDVLGTLAGLLAADPVTEDGTIWVWPREYLEDGYLGYRVGIRADGTWLFYVAGD